MLNDKFNDKSHGCNCHFHLMYRWAPELHKPYIKNVSTEVFLPKALIVYIGLKALVYQNKWALPDTYSQRDKTKAYSYFLWTPCKLAHP